MSVIKDIREMWNKRNSLFLVKGYLKNRQQSVQINTTVFEFRKVQCGVPQGSVIGLKLFRLYINDIDNLLK